MAERSWCILAVLSLYVAFCTSARKEFSISEICENLATYYKLIDPLVNYRIPLDFEQRDRYLRGKGDMTFSPQFSITDCKAAKRSSFIYITANIKDNVTIMFKNSSWVLLDNSLLKIKIKMENMGESKKVILTSVDVGFRQAVVDDRKQSDVSSRSIKAALKRALYSAFHIPYSIQSDFEVSEAVAKSAMNGAFIYYVYRLK